MFTRYTYQGNLLRRFIMKVVLFIMFINVVLCQSSQTSESLDRKEERGTGNESRQKLRELLLERLQAGHSNSNPENPTRKTKEINDLKNLGRKPKSLAFYPYFAPPLIPFGPPPPPPPPYFYPQNKDIVENPFANEWISRTEPYKKNPPLLDSPTYYIRLPPNPYAFIPGLGYISRPPSLSDPELLDNNNNNNNNKPEQSSEITSGNDIATDPFYRLPINFLSNGKPTSVYQLPNQIPSKPESGLVNLNKGPYVFNGKPSEIFLVAQIYDALYGDELTHFYP